MARSLSANTLIIGAGTAGSVIAAELSKDPARQIILVEAGPADMDPRLHDPQDWPLLSGGVFDWGYQTAPQRALAGRVLAYPRGRVLGGSSSINAMWHQRGHFSIFDQWRSLGCEGWGFSDLLPLFQAQETFDSTDPKWRGGSGPISVIRPRPSDRSDFAAAFLEAAVQAGHPLCDDFNAETMNGASWNQLAISRSNRSSAATAYLRGALVRPNLRVLVDSFVELLAFEGDRCIGANLWRDGQCQTVRAQETIMCAGAIDTPRLLMLSGIGETQSLSDLGIKVRASSPEVGQNLQDHPLCGIVHNVSRKLPRSPYNHGEAIVFANSTLERTAPDIQIMGVDLPFTTPQTAPGPAEGFSIAPCLMTPMSRGSVTLTTNDPRTPARIDPNYLDAPEDMDRFICSIRLARRIGAQPALARWSAGEHACGPAGDSDGELHAFACRAVSPFFHPVGTCRMGPESLGVVDPQLNVYGVRGLRVADASIMPLIPNAMPNAAIVAIALKAAKMIAAK
jgi:choline dehydrogenase